ncbi:hypothetical protein V1477_002554 [Vespula maculifrons]|uniref:Uncharacterized protein n=1 Tax=Vespula maculifrons TaxID=7453 RepID=A0ABD2CXZ1_VESMC
MDKDLTFSNFNLVVVAVQERLLGFVPATADGARPFLGVDRAIRSASKVQHPISWTINIRCFFTTQTRVLAQVRRRNAIASSSFLFFEQCVTSDRGSQARFVKFTLIIFEISYLGLREKRREDKRRR